MMLILHLCYIITREDLSQAVETKCFFLALQSDVVVIIMKSHMDLFMSLEIIRIQADPDECLGLGRRPGRRRVLLVSEGHNKHGAGFNGGAAYLPHWFFSIKLCPRKTAAVCF